MNSTLATIGVITLGLVIIYRPSFLWSLKKREIYKKLQAQDWDLNASYFGLFNATYNKSNTLKIEKVEYGYNLYSLKDCEKTHLMTFTCFGGISNPLRKIMKQVQSQKKQIDIINDKNIALKKEKMVLDLLNSLP